MTEDEAKEFETMRGPERPLQRAVLERLLHENPYAAEHEAMLDKVRERSCIFRYLLTANIAPLFGLPGYVPPFHPIRGL